MAFSHEFESVIRSYLDGDLSLDELQDWLDAHVQATADSADPAAIELSDRAWILLSELGYGIRTDESVRAEFRQLLPSRCVATIEWAIPTRTLAYSWSAHITSSFQPSAVPLRAGPVPVARFP